MIGIGRNSLRARLMLTFSLTLTVTLFASVVATLVWFYHFEREEFRESMMTQVAVLATNSTAALMFRDYDTLTQNLSVLQHLKSVRWAAVVAESTPVAVYLTPPMNLDSLRQRFADGESLIETASRLTLRKQIQQGEYVAGELLVEFDLNEGNVQVAIATLLAIGMMLVAVVLSMPVFFRQVEKLVKPLNDLTRLSQVISAHGDQSERSTLRGADEIGRLGENFNLMLDSLSRRDVELRLSRDKLRELNQRLESVLETERTRISREIHDELGQRLTALKLDVFRLFRPTDAATAAEIESVASQFDQAVRAVREISWDLRPSVLDTVGLMAAIEWLGGEFQRRTSTRCRIVLPDPAAEIDAAIATQLFRICQELLTNAARHARASRVDILLELGADVRLDVSDNGVGIPAVTHGGRSLGLLGVEERVRHMGGRLMIQTRPDFDGTRISIIAPRFAQGARAENESGESA